MLAEFEPGPFQENFYLSDGVFHTDNTVGWRNNPGKYRKSFKNGTMEDDPGLLIGGVARHLLRIRSMKCRNWGLIV